MGFLYFPIWVWGSVCDPKGRRAPLLQMILTYGKTWRYNYLVDCMIVFFFLCCLLFLRLPVEREADVETFFRAGDFRFDSGLRFCNCCVDVVFSQAFLQKTHVQDSSFVAFRLESRFRKKIKVFFCQISRRQCCGEHFFSLIPLHIEKNKSVDIRQKFLYWFLILHSDFQKRQNARKRCWLCFPSRVCGVASKRS